MIEYNLLQLPAQQYLDKLAIKYIVKHNNSWQQKNRARANKKYKGYADLEVLFKNGKAVFFEFKDKKNVLSKEQIEIKEYLIKNGFDYYEIRNIEKFYKIVDIYI